MSDKANDVATDNARNTGSQRIYVRMGLSLILSVIALIFIARFIDITIIWEKLLDLDMGYTGLSICSFLLYQILRANRLAMLVRFCDQPTVSRKPISLLVGVVSQGLANNVLPAGLGELVLIGIVRRLLAPSLANSVAVVLVSRVADMSILAMGAAVSFFFTRNTLPPVLLWAAIGLGVLAAGLIFSVVFAYKILQAPISKFAHFSIVQQVETFVKTLAGATRQLGGARSIAYLVAITLAIWLVNFASGWSIILALELPLTVMQYVWIYLLTFPVNLLPFKTVGNVGAFEANWVLVLGALGLSSKEALEIAVSAHVGLLAVMVATTLPVLATYFAWRNLQNVLRWFRHFQSRDSGSL